MSTKLIGLTLLVQVQKQCISKVSGMYIGPTEQP